MSENFSHETDIKIVNVKGLEFINVKNPICCKCQQRILPSENFNSTAVEQGFIYQHDRCVVPRPSWDRYFLEMARVASLRSTCDRKHVGCVIAKGNWHIATGYNGSICGLPHCDEVGHLMENDHCVRTVHAEENAIASAAKHGIAVDGATLYSTASPCWLCFRICANAGIKRMIFAEFYRDEKIFEAAKLAGIELIDANTLP